VTPGTGDHSLKINKSASGKTASVVMRDNASGRAEFGLLTDDNFRLKVSANGSTWTEAFVVSASSGETTIKKDLVLPDGIKIVNRGTDANAGAEIEGADNLGPCSLKVINHAGVAAGTVFTQKSTNSAIDLIDFGLQTLTKLMLLRAEARVASALFTPPDFQIIDNTGGVTEILFRGAKTASKSEKPFVFKSYAKAPLPAASIGAGACIYVNDEAGGAVLAFSDGTNRRRVTDRAVVS